MVASDMVIGDMTVGERIRQIRKEKALTQKKLAEISGVSENAIKQYENNKRTPRLEQLNKIADALGVCVYTLVEDDDLALKTTLVDTAIDDLSKILEPMDPWDIRIPSHLSSIISHIQECMSVKNTKIDYITRLTTLLESLDHILFFQNMDFDTPENENEYVKILDSIIDYIHYKAKQVEEYSNKKFKNKYKDSEANSKKEGD